MKSVCIYLFVKIWDDVKRVKLWGQDFWRLYMRPIEVNDWYRISVNYQKMRGQEIETSCWTDYTCDSSTHQNHCESSNAEKFSRPVENIFNKSGVLGSKGCFNDKVFLENKIEVTLLSNKNEQQIHLVHLSRKI